MIYAMLATRQRAGNFFSPEQQHAAREYHAHHFSCSVCLQAGRRYGTRCAVGASLWVAYQLPEYDGGMSLAQAERDSDLTAAVRSIPHGNHGDNLRSVQE